MHVGDVLSIVVDGAEMCAELLEVLGRWHFGDGTSLLRYGTDALTGEYVSQIFELLDSYLSFLLFDGETKLLDALEEFVELFVVIDDVISVNEKIVQVRRRPPLVLRSSCPLHAGRRLVSV